MNNKVKIITSGNDKTMVSECMEVNPGNAGEMQTVKLYAHKKYQTILGMGGAITEAASSTYKALSDENKEKLLNLYYGPDGIGYNMARVHIQSCDFSKENYQYVDDPTDRELKTFDMSHDYIYQIPFIKEVLKRNKDIVFMATPWSPPGFMKTNGEMNHGGKLKEEYADMWADMISKFIVTYRSEGINITRLSIQNEPAATQTWDSCVFTGKEEALFAVNHLRKSLDKNGLNDVKIIVWDHNKDIIVERTEDSFSVEGAKEVIDGIAYHWYTGDHFEALKEVVDTYPDKEYLFTEGCVEYSRFTGDRRLVNAEMYGHEILGDFLCGGNAFLDWNIYLDKQGGPNHVGNYCDAPVMCDIENETIDVKLSYYYIGHFSKFIKPGAVRTLVSKYSSDIECVGFINPDGERVVVVLNKSDVNVPFKLTDGKGFVEIESEAHTIKTILFNE